MREDISSGNQKVVIMDGDANAIRYITFEEFQELPLDKRRHKTKRLLEYLRASSEIPVNAFRNSDGSDIEHLTVNHLRQCVMAPNGRNQAFAIPRERPYTPAEVWINWMSVLQTAYDHPASAHIKLLESQKRVLEKLLQMHKARWMKQDLAISIMKYTLKNDSRLLEFVGLYDLADLAFNDDGDESLYDKLSLYDYDPATVSLRSNIHNRVFEIHWMSNLIAEPTEQLLHAMGQVGEGINSMLNALYDDGLKKDFIHRLKKRINQDRHHWHEQIPALQNIIQADTVEGGLVALRSILTTMPMNGYEVIAIPYLWQKIYPAYVNTLSSNRIPLPEWIKSTQNRLNPVLGTPMIAGDSQSIEPDRSVNSDASVRWHSSISSQNNPTNSKAPSNSYVSFPKDIAGSTNLFLDMIDHFVSDQHLSIDRAQALLGLTLFSVCNNGLPMHKILSAVHQRQSQLLGNKDLAAGVDKTDVLAHAAVFDYGQLSNLFEQSAAATLTLLDSTRDNAWKKTIAYFNERGNYWQRFAAKKMIADLESGIQMDVTVRLQKMLALKPELSTSKSRLDAAKELERIVYSYDFDKKDAVLTILDGIIKKEIAQPKLVAAMDKHLAFDDFDRKEVWRLVIDKFQQDRRGEYGFEDESGYTAGAFNALTYMLEHKDEMLTADTLLRLHDIAVDGVLKLNKTWGEVNRFKMFMGEEALNEYYFLPKGYRNNIGNKFGLAINPLGTPNDGQNASIAGYHELLKKHDNNNHLKVIAYNVDVNGDPVADDEGRIGEVWTLPKTAEECAAYAQGIIDAYHEELKLAVTNDEKLTAIARVCRDLESAHVFPDGNCRTMAIVLYKLLLQNGFQPIILDNPNLLDGSSVQELVVEIKKGQSNFKAHLLPSTARHDRLQIDSELAYKSVMPTVVYNDDNKSRYQEEYLKLESKLLDQKEANFVNGSSDLFYKKIRIPGYVDDMSLEELHQLALEGDLDLKQLGALVRRIGVANYYIARRSVISSSEEVARGKAIFSEYFNDPSNKVQPIYEKPVSQRLLLLSDTSGSSGLCYGLTLTMAIALSQGGENGVNIFIDRLYQVGDYPAAQQSIWLKDALSKVHQYANNMYIKRNMSGKMSHTLSLAEIYDELNKATGTTMYELSTPNHVMMVACVWDGTDPKFYFYDPEFGIVAYRTTRELDTALSKYLNEGRLIKYGISGNGNGSVPKFEFTPINVGELTGIRFKIGSDFHLTPSMLSEAESFTKRIDSQRNLKLQHGASLDKLVSEVNTNKDLVASLSEFERKKMAKSFYDAFDGLYEAESISRNLIPILASIKETVREGVYEISFFDPKDDTKLYKAETRNATFKKVKNYLDNLLSKGFNKRSLEGSSLGKRPTADGSLPPGTGLSLLFAIKVYFSSSEVSEFSRLNPLSENLARAVQLHTYFDCLGLGIGSLQDVMAVGSLGYANPLKHLIVQDHVKSYIHVAKKIGLDVKPLEQALPKLLGMLNTGAKPLNVLGKVVWKVLPVVNTAVSVVSVGFDAYELAHAENSHQKKIFGTQLAFSSAGLGLAAGGTVAALVGASSIATPLFLLAIPVGVVGGGIVATMNDAENVEQAVKHHVVHYFNQVADAYQKGYDYNASTNVFTTVSGAVVQKLNFETGELTFGSQYLCVRDPNSLRRVNSDNSTALNLRLGLGGKEAVGINSEAKNAKTVVLPNTLNSFVSYNTANI